MGKMKEAYLTQQSERHAIWELIGAIDWIKNAWESGDLAAAVRHASELASNIAQRFPDENEKPF
jgi:hypothetical protein